MLFKYSGKYVNIYFNMKITFQLFVFICKVKINQYYHIGYKERIEMIH